MTVRPGQKGTARVEEVSHPDGRDGALLVRGRALGVCGTDREIADSAYGTRRAPLTSWTEALDRHPEDIKVVVDLTA